MMLNRFKIFKGYEDMDNDATYILVCALQYLIDGCERSPEIMMRKYGKALFEALDKFSIEE